MAHSERKLDSGLTSSRLYKCLKYFITNLSVPQCSFMFTIPAVEHNSFALINKHDFQLKKKKKKKSYRKFIRFSFVS